MKKKIGFHVAFAFGALCTFSSHCHGLTLKEAVNQALDSSPAIKKAQSSSSEAHWRVKESLSGFLPSVSVNASHLLEKKYALTNIRMGNSLVDTVVPQIIPTSQLALSTSFPLFEGFSSTHRYEGAKDHEGAMAHELQWAQLKMEMDVTLAYYKALANKILEEVAKQNLSVLQDHLKEVKLFKQNGMATHYDVLRVEVQASNAETDLLNASDNFLISEQNLIELLGGEVPGAGPIALDGQLPVLEESVMDSLASFDWRERSDLLALKEHAASLAHADVAQKAFWVPRFSLFGNYQYYNNLDDSLTNTDKYRSAYQVGVQMSWNLFDGLTSFARSKQTTEQLVQAQASLRMNELKAQKDLEIWKRKCRYFISLYKARKNDIQKSEESVRLAREGRRVGARTNTDLLDAETDLYKSKAGAVNAQIGAVEALVNLQLSLGQKVKAFY